MSRGRRRPRGGENLRHDGSGYPANYVYSITIDFSTGAISVQRALQRTRFLINALFDGRDFS